MAATDADNAPRALAHRALALVALLTLSLLASVLLVPRAAAIGQPTLGYSEVSGAAVEQFQLMGADYAVRTNLTFTRTELVRVNVTSSVVDWNTRAGGVGSRVLTLQRFDGTTVATATFAEATVAGVYVYSASIGLSPLTLAPDWYYLHILIDDTITTFSATSAVRVAPTASAHILETYTDSTFAHPSDVFTPTSVVWVKVVGLAGADANEWDLGQFVVPSGASNSVVGGPNTNFDNFQRNGNTYTFSIDLSPFAATLNNAWSYTLAVRLTGLAFNAAKQIQIYTPTVNVAAANLAPARAFQGQTGVTMLELTLSLPAWPTGALGPAAFDLDRVQIARLGSGTNADVSGVHLWNDVNGNGIVDSGDVLLASAADPGGVPFPVWVGQPAMVAFGPNAPLHLLVTADIAPGGTVGDTAGLQIQALGLSGAATVQGLPASSGLVQIAGATVLTATDNAGVAPATVVQGQGNVPMDLLRLSTNGPVLTVTQISVAFRGTGTASDIAAVSLHVDDGDGIYEPARDPILGLPTGFPSSGPAVFSGLAFQVDSVGRSVWIVYTVSATATLGDRVGSALPSNASIALASGSVYGGTFPLNSGLTTIVGPTLTVTWRNLAPAQAHQGRQNLPMLALTLSVNYGQSNVSGFRIDKTGTSTLGSDVPLAKIWLDNGDGLFDSGDVLLGQGSFVGGTTVIGGLSIFVSASAPRTLFLTYDTSPGATVGATVAARLRNPSYVSVDMATTVSAQNFPIQSAEVTILAPGSGAILTIGSVDMAAWSPLVYAGQTNILMEKLYLTVDQNAGQVLGMRVDKLGTSTSDSDVVVLKLWLDADGNGNLSAGDRVLATTTFVAGVAVFPGLNLLVPVNQPVTLFLTIDIARSPSVGKTVSLALATSSYVVGNSTTTIDPNSFPIDSSNVRIATGALSGSVVDAGGHPIAGATVTIPQLNLTTTTDANGGYSFPSVPVGTWYVLVKEPGYVTGNKTDNATPAAPNQVVNFVLSPTPPSSGLTGTLVAVIVGSALALIALAVFLLFFVVRRRSHCPICGKPKPRDLDVCSECEARGLHPPGAGLMPPPPPPPNPPSAP